MKILLKFLIIIYLFFLACSKTSDNGVTDNITKETEKLYENFNSTVVEIKNNNEIAILKFNEMLDSVNKVREQTIDSLRLHLSEKEIEIIENQNRERLMKISNLINEEFPEYKQFFNYE